MEIELVRDVYTSLSTGGQLFVQGAWECFTLELADRQGDIPEGRYRVVPNQSPRFGMRVPLLQDVPRRQLIEIHPGNTTRDTHGCILVGRDRQADVVMRSRFAFASLMPKLEAAWAMGQEVWITVRSSDAPMRAVA